MEELAPQIRFQCFKEGWPPVSLGEALSIFNGYAFESSKASVSGVKWVKIADVGIQSMKHDNISYLPQGYGPKYRKFLLKKGDYVIALTRPVLNGQLKIARICDTFDGSLLNQRVGRLITDNNSSFIYNLLQRRQIIKSIESNIAGTDPPNLSMSAIAAIQIHLPSLPEQQKIAEFLSAVDDKIQKLQKKKDLLERYKKGVMQRIFNQEIRFRDDEGKDYPGWETTKLSELTERVTMRNRKGNLNVLTISAQHGLINQLKYFNNSVASTQLSNYYLLNKNDFAYNKSYSKGYPMGAIKRLTRYDEGIVSPLYICFRTLNNLDEGYAEQYFEFGQQNKEIEKVAQEGARNHGLLNIGVPDFFSIAIDIPCLREQTKISNFLSTIDEKINITNKQLDHSKLFKKGLLQQMFV